MDRSELTDRLKGFVKGGLFVGAVASLAYVHDLVGSRALIPVHDFHYDGIPATLVKDDRIFARDSYKVIIENTAIIPEGIVKGDEITINLIRNTPEKKARSYTVSANR